MVNATCAHAQSAVLLIIKIQAEKIQENVDYPLPPTK